MSFATLALISLVAIVGPLLALPRRWHLPVMLGELAAGIVLGPTGIGRLQAHNETFTFLAEIGFALIMFVVGSQVPVRDGSLRTALRIGVLRAAGVGVLSVPLAPLVAKIFGTGHTALYAVLMASSSAALILPVVESLHLGGRPVLQLLPQVAIADTACIVALPLAIDPKHAGRAALGALAVLAAAALLFVILRHLERAGIRQRAHDVSHDREFALELRISLAILFALAALATRTHVSIMLAGFSFGFAPRCAAAGLPPHAAPRRPAPPRRCPPRPGASSRRARPHRPGPATRTRPPRKTRPPGPIARPDERTHHRPSPPGRACQRDLTEPAPGGTADAPCAAARPRRRGHGGVVRILTAQDPDPRQQIRTDGRAVVERSAFAGFRFPRR